MLEQAVQAARVAAQMVGLMARQAVTEQQILVVVAVVAVMLELARQVEQEAPVSSS
jgi:hypothetical protein